MNPIKFLVAAIFRWPLVWTQDFDGDVRLRRAYPSPFGGAQCKGIMWRDVILQADGTTAGCVFVRRWTPANSRAALLFPKASALES